MTTKPPRRSKHELALMKRYFQPWPGWVTALAVVGVGLLIVSSSEIDEDTTSTFTGIGLIMAVAALAGAINWLIKPSGTRMDAWLRQDLAYLESKAIVKCQLEDERISQHIVLTGPRFGDIGADWAYKRERSGMMRVTPVGVTILNFTEHEVFAYTCAIDRLKDRYVAEETDEYFYRDVVSVATKTKDMVLDKRSLPRALRRAVRKDIRRGELHVPGAEVFTLTTSGGTSVEAVIDVRLEAIGGRLRTMDGGHVEDVIRQMRKHLRERKHPADGRTAPAAERDGWLE